MYIPPAPHHFRAHSRVSGTNSGLPKLVQGPKNTLGARLGRVFERFDTVVFFGIGGLLLIVIATTDLAVTQTQKPRPLSVADTQKILSSALDAETAREAHQWLTSHPRVNDADVSRVARGLSRLSHLRSRILATKIQAGLP